MIYKSVLQMDWTSSRAPGAHTHTNDKNESQTIMWDERSHKKGSNYLICKKF